MNDETLKSRRDFFKKTLKGAFFFRSAYFI